MPDNPILWIHADALSPNQPALDEFPDAPAIYVWDDALLEEWNISLKRIVFMYECLLEMPVTIRRGDVAEQVIAFAREHGAARIITVESVSPRFEAILARLERDFEVEVILPDALVEYDGEIDLKRFSRYWATAQKYAFGGKS
jgi:hypothetical protein